LWLTDFEACLETLWIAATWSVPWKEGVKEIERFLVPGKEDIKVELYPKGSLNPKKCRKYFLQFKVKPK
jgi:hypothetical protein